MFETKGLMCNLVPLVTHLPIKTSVFSKTATFKLPSNLIWQNL